MAGVQKEQTWDVSESDERFCDLIEKLRQERVRSDQRFRQERASADQRFRQMLKSFREHSDRERERYQQHFDSTMASWRESGGKTLNSYKSSTDVKSHNEKSNSVADTLTKDVDLVSTDISTSPNIDNEASEVIGKPNAFSEANVKSMQVTRPYGVVESHDETQQRPMLSSESEIDQTRNQPDTKVSSMPHEMPSTTDEIQLGGLRQPASESTGKRENSDYEVVQPLLQSAVETSIELEFEVVQPDKFAYQVTKVKPSSPTIDAIVCSAPRVKGNDLQSGQFADDPSLLLNIHQIQRTVPGQQLSWCSYGI